MRSLDYGKILHWLFLVFFLVLGFTAIMNTTFYSKEAIMETFEFSFPMVELYDVAASDKLFIARIERREGWVFHFWVGVGAFVLTLLRLYFVRKQKKSLLTKIFYITFIIMFLSGLPLFIRTYVEIEQSYQDIARFIHYYSSWVLVAYLVIHIGQVIYKENKKNSNSISNMMKFKKHLFVFALFTSMFVSNNNLLADENYDLAMKYKTGKIGSTTQKKIMPNCPYEYCKKAEEMKKKMNVKVENDTQTYKLVIKDLKSALMYFNKSIEESNNPKSVKEALDILLKSINFKDKKLNEYLVHKMEEDLGVSVEQYKKLIRIYLTKSYEFKECRGSFYYAQFIEKGYVDIFTKVDNVKDIYANVSNYCNSIPFLKMQAQAKAK